MQQLKVTYVSAAGYDTKPGFHDLHTTRTTGGGSSAKFLEPSAKISANYRNVCAHVDGFWTRLSVQLKEFLGRGPAMVDSGGYFSELAGIRAVCKGKRAVQRGQL